MAPARLAVAVPLLAALAGAARPPEQDDDFGTEDVGTLAGFVTVKKGARCGTRGQLLARDTREPEDCAHQVFALGSKAFSFGRRGKHAGWCFMEGLPVTQELLDDWADHPDLEQRRCPASQWQSDPDFDFFALEITRTDADGGDSGDFDADGFHVGDDIVNATRNWRPKPGEEVELSAAAADPRIINKLAEEANAHPVQVEVPGSVISAVGWGLGEDASAAEPAAPAPRGGALRRTGGASAAAPRTVPARWLSATTTLSDGRAATTPWEEEAAPRDA